MGVALNNHGGWAISSLHSSVWHFERCDTNNRPARIISTQGRDRSPSGPRLLITPDTALRLSRYFGTSAEFWRGVQKAYELRKAREELGAAIEEEVTPLAVAS